MSATSSLTKSCFAFVPISRKSSALDSRNCFEQCANELDQSSAGVRSDGFESVWSTANTLCSDFQESMYNTIFADMIAFLKSPVVAEEDCIPTAALVTGVNMPDHGGVFSSLTERLRAHVSPHVAVLEPSACSTVAAAVKSMIDQLTTDPQAERVLPLAPLYDDDEEEDGLLVEEPQRTNERPITTMPALVDFSEVTHASSNDAGSPSKRIKLERPPLVVVWRELEAFLPKVLQDLVLICSQYRRRVPIVFVFGISTSASEVHRLLPQHVSARLSLKKFHSQLATHYLTSIIDKVVLSAEVPFRLGGRAFRLLLDMFLYNDFSVNNFMSAYKYCMLHHFLTAPASVLCCCRSEIASTVEALTSDQLSRLRDVGSVKAELKAGKTLSDAEFKSWLTETLRAFHAKHDGLLLGLRCLWALVARLPGSPMGRQFRELYNTALLHPLADRDEYVQCVRLLGMMSRNELTASLQASYDVATEMAPSSELCDNLQRHLESVQTLDARPVEETPEEASQQRRHLQKQLQQATSRAQLREMMESMGAERNRRQNPFEALRSSLVADLDARLGRLISRPSTWTLHEALVFDSASAVKRHLVATPRIALQTALSDPARYLECDCCQLENPGSVLASMPDICIVYKLHTECGKLINLYDWLQAFRAVVGVQGGDDDETLQARFADAVTQLQYLGFVKSTQRKADHVQRLTWGSC